EFARRYKEPTIAIVAKYNPSPAAALAEDYDTALAAMTPDGWVSDEVFREEVATRAELIKAANPPDARKLYDYAIVKKISAELKKSGKP
ncbi:MAG TPA: hypothetical protein VGA73_08470, partial [Candidatus Binatia bacterium]